ncbi:MAG: flavin reductase family protein [Pseudomonadota bacterium]
MDALIPFDPNESTALRRAFGRFGTGVTVITIAAPEGPIGMTANSFASVSLDPPLVVWSAAHRSHRHDAFVSAKHFCIHILSADQYDLAMHFASRGHDFSQLSWTNGPTGAPMLPGCLATLHCASHAVHPAGDHSLIIGQVTHAANREDHAHGLLFEQGRFGRFSPRDQ